MTAEGSADHDPSLEKRHGFPPPPLDRTRATFNSAPGQSPHKSNVRLGKTLIDRESGPLGIGTRQWMGQNS